VYIYASVGGPLLVISLLPHLCIFPCIHVYCLFFLLVFPTYLNRVASMEASQPLSIESFSYSWLVNLKPSLESLENSCRASLDASDEASFIEMDPRMTPSKRFFRNSQDFKFDFPAAEQSPFTLVHADQLFSNGYVMPLFVDPLKMGMEACYEAPDNSTPSRPSSSHAPKILAPDDNINPYCSSSKRVHKVVKNWVYSSEASPRISVAYSVDDWRKSCDSESSIYEAVLHCKRSIGIYA